MEASKQTIQQIERTLRKVIAKFPADAEPVMTDIHLLVSNYTGEIRTYNDDDEELDRCVVEQWIKSSDEDFYEDIVPILRRCIEDMRPSIMQMSIMQPFSFVLIDIEVGIVTVLVADDTVGLALRHQVCRKASHRRGIDPVLTGRGAAALDGT